MKQFYNTKQNIKSEDRIRMIILSSLFACILFVSACSNKPTMEKVDDIRTLPVEEADQIEENEKIEETTKYSNIYIHVCGAVVNPGVYELKEGHRVIDAINLAGGVTDDACADAVNLAKEVADGEKIYIPTKKEALDGVFVNANEELSGVTSRKININTADESKLCEITGIGATRAKAIIQYREGHGGFKTIEELKNVTGIGEKTFEKIKEEITVS